MPGPETRARARNSADPARGATVEAAAPVRTGADRRARAGGDAGTLGLGALADVLGYHVAQAAVVTSASFARHVGEPLQLRKVEYSLLLLLLENGAQTPKVLGQALALTAPNLTLLLDRLQQRGLIDRQRSTTDRRSQNVLLTEAGEHLAQRGVQAIAPMEAEAVSERLSPVERLMLIELLRKVSGH